MRIRFTWEEVDELLELLRYNTDACTDGEVEILSRLIRKLEKSGRYSHSNKMKIRGVAKETIWEYDVVRPVKEKLKKERLAKC